MALTPSTMLPLGTPAPAFALTDMRTNQVVNLPPVGSAPAVVVMFICNHCPYVKHIQHKLVEVAKRFATQGVLFFAINSNDTEKYPADSPEKMREEAEAHHYNFPYLFDPTQEVARAYQAACTPDFYIFDQSLACVYRGRFDDSTPGNHLPVTGHDLSAALDALLAGKALTQEQLPSVGCNIKWR